MLGNLLAQLLYPSGGAQHKAKLLRPAQRHMAAAETAQAAACYRRLLSYAPDNIDALSALGTIVSLRGRRDEARELYLRALDLLEQGFATQPAAGQEAVLEARRFELQGAPAAQRAGNAGVRAMSCCWRACTASCGRVITSKSACSRRRPCCWRHRKPSP